MCVLVGIGLAGLVGLAVGLIAEVRLENEESSPSLGSTVQPLCDPSSSLPFLSFLVPLWSALGIPFANM